MDNRTIYKTMKALRERVFAFLGQESNPFVKDQLWDDIQSADEALAFLFHQGSKPIEGVEERVVSFITRQSAEMGQLKGLIKSVVDRHPVLEKPYMPLAQVTTDHELMAIGRDFWLLLTLLKENTNADIEPEPVPTGFSQSGGERQLQQGGVRLFDHGTPEAAAHGGPEGEVQGPTS